VASEISIALLSGGFALAGGLGGVLLSGWLSRRSDDRKVAAADARRWLEDRRHVYAAYLGLAESMLQEIDRVALFLSYDGEEPFDEDDEALVRDGLADYWVRWDEEVQPALGEVQLIAEPAVADLADRVSGALMELTAVPETRGPFTAHYPMWFQTQDLLHVLRNAMRKELGLASVDLAVRPHAEDWPWLPGRPPRESYVQHHDAGESAEPAGRGHPSRGEDGE